MKPAVEVALEFIPAWNKGMVRAATKAITQARREGAEDMREQAAQILDAAFAGVLDAHGIKPDSQKFRLMDDLATTTAEIIRALPLEAESEASQK